MKSKGVKLNNDKVTNLEEAVESIGTSLLGKRYEFNDVPLLKLNDLQNRIKEQVSQKVHQGIYQFEKVNCCICGGSAFEQIATKDRYGLYMPVCICMQCGLIQTNPRMTQAAYLDFYNNEYRKLYTGSETATRTFFASQYKKGHRIYHYLNDERSFSTAQRTPFVVEVGCGAGGILQYFKENGWQVKGIDLGEEYVQFGKTEYGLDLSVGSLADIQIANAPDLIIYSHVLEHLLTPNEEMSLVKSILPDNGRIYIEVPGVKYLMKSYEMDFLRYLQNAHTYHFTLCTLTNLMRKNGFEIITGDEHIYSLFMKNSQGNPSAEIVNDYTEALSYLRKTERMRKFLPITPDQARRAPKQLAINLLKSIGLYNNVKKLRNKR